MASLWLTLAERCLLVGLFLPFSALDKLLNFEAAVDQAAQAVRVRALAALLTLSGLAIEVLMSLAVLTGIADRFAALVLAVYCLITALLWKQFWRTPDFRLRGASGGREVFWDFLKNCALAGGFLLLAFGGDRAGVERFWQHPLASSQPYAATGPEASGT
ncbi:MAG: DoxX family membrane protein [Steroidobacteraceae bacterium]